MTIDAALKEMLRELVREEVRAAVAEVPMPVPANTNAGSRPDQDAEYIDDKALAVWIGISRETLQSMRTNGEGPPFVKVARRAIRYHVPSVRAWLTAQTRGRLAK